jgi:hypothetical protein
MRLETFNKELENIFSTPEFEEEGGIFISGTHWFSDDLKIEFVIKTGVEQQKQLWEVQVKGVRDELIKSDTADKLELFEEHPLLWTYNQRQTNLYFGQSTSRPYELFTDIYAIHLRLTKNWIPFNKNINTNVSIIDLCKSPSGLFASGPNKLMEQYQKILMSHDMNPTIVGGHYPKRWKNGYKVDETEIVNVLVLGESYVIGESFDFNRV